MNDFNPSPEFEDKVRQALNVPAARPEFVSKLRNELVGRPSRTTPRYKLTFAWAVAFVLIVLVLAISAPQVVTALKQLLGYVPGVGLVENTGDLRMLAEPVSVTRDGVTLTVKHVWVYADRIELAYDVAGIEPSNDGTSAEDLSTHPTAFCGGVNVGEMAIKDGDALLRLPDGTTLERETTGLYPQNVFAMTLVYKASLPADVTEMTLILKCIPWARLGAVPENWEVPFQLVSVPAETVVGSPVIEVEQPTETPYDAPAPEQTEQIAPPAIPVAPVVSLDLERIVPLDSATVFYFSMDMENKDPSLVSIMPVNVYVIDSLGQKIRLIGYFPWQPFEHRVGSSFEFTSQSRPADGPLTLQVENAVAYYAPLYVEPRQATPEEMSFTFDAGSSPQHGQTWDLHQNFEIAGYTFDVNAARAVAWDDVKTPQFIDGSQGYEYGYQFTIQGQSSMKMNVELDILSERCGFTVGVPWIPEHASLLNTQLCREAYPQGQVTVVIRQVSVLMEHTWQSAWTPSDK